MEIRKEMLSVQRPVGGYEEINSIKESIMNGWWTKGPKVEEFERKFAEYVGAKYAVAMSSWTSGLHMACHAIGLDETNSLITSPITFVASSNAASPPRFFVIIISNLLLKTCEETLELHE